MRHGAPQAAAGGGGERTVALLTVLFPLFAALLVWPLLTMANSAVRVAGIPALVLYLFTVWAVIVAVLAWAGHRVRREDSQ